MNSWRFPICNFWQWHLSKGSKYKFFCYCCLIERYRFFWWFNEPSGHCNLRDCINNKYMGQWNLSGWIQHRCICSISSKKQADGFFCRNTWEWHLTRNEKKASKAELFLLMESRQINCLSRIFMFSNLSWQKPFDHYSCFRQGAIVRVTSTTRNFKYFSFGFYLNL